MKLMLTRLHFLNGYEDLDSSEAEVNFDEESSADIESDEDDSGLEEESAIENSGATDRHDHDEGQSLNSENDEKKSTEEPTGNEANDDVKEPKIAKRAPNARRASIRDKLIFREINNDKLSECLPSSCKLSFDDPDELHKIRVVIQPDEGFWKGGKFVFTINVTEEYNYEPPKVKCLTKIWHPNITEEGDVCLSILRSAGIDEHCWSPARQLKDVILGINSLFTDLLNFHDPLNTEAAEMYERNPREFTEKVKNYIRYYAT